MSEAALDYLRMPLDSFLKAVASGEPAPAGGSAAAAVVALAAGLVCKSARLSTQHLPGAAGLAEQAEGLMKGVVPLVREDAAAYAEVLAARREGREMEEALSGAADVPLAIAEAGEEVARIATLLAAEGKPALRGDAQVAALLAGAASQAAALLAGINLRAAGVRDGRLRRVEELAGEKRRRQREREK
ncbi:MAG: cyclodeaminase/cyclohydrolase family protein [Actinomycetota bacterium]